MTNLPVLIWLVIAGIGVVSGALSIYISVQVHKVLKDDPDPLVRNIVNTNIRRAISFLIAQLTFVALGVLTFFPFDRVWGAVVVIVGLLFGNSVSVTDKVIYLVLRYRTIENLEQQEMESSQR